MIKNLPIRLDYYQYAAETWQELFKEFNFSEINSVANLLLGWSPKIELALLKTAFKGILYAVDKSMTNLNCYNQLQVPFSKKFQVKLIKADLLKNLDIQTDLVIVNHAIDDLILDLYLKGKDVLLTDFFENPDLMKKTWNEILSTDILWQDTLLKLKNVFRSLVKPNGYLIFTQYLGYQEKLYGLEQVYLKCHEILKEIEKDFIQSRDFTNKKEIIANAFSRLPSPYFPAHDVICLKRVA